ncbi:efflux transporter outer membrane subunit [Sphingomonas sp. BAUL-RG-20F-R05-02]|uniref:efflux transporter outer membrane subunit n=1 Tax=Sphingomonas sp. BAUL-RG-20F-R05-02 TaxID=2914830 RepID=UPI001F5837A7|nr:efflux transporter outer membrane subunit [Sphingomonas sp. BAUL-RG-20F-R05-02]
MAKRTLFALVLAAGTAGCSFAPPYHPPVTTPVVAYKEAGPWQPAATTAALPGDWWTVFDDATLDHLEAKIASDNPTLAGALARYDGARAALGQTRAGLLPTLGVDTSLTRNRQSDNRPLRGANQPDVYSADTVEASFGYEIDLWGRVRNSVAAGNASVQASGDDLAAIRLSLQADLASDYMALRGYDRQAELLTQTVAAFARADHLIARRFQAGIASGIETSRSGAQLAEARAQLADVAAARAVTEHAIASLTGTPASNFSIAPNAPDVAVPAVPIGLPSTLIERRPDIAAAERRVAAANAGIGVAKAAFFPAIRLGASGGFQNTGLPGLISAPNEIWSIGPSAVLNLFDGGRRRAELAAARARWASASADYRATVLTAFQQVEDNLAQLRHLGDEAAAENEAVRQAAITERLTLHRYTKGAVTYLEVFTAQTTALRARRAALDLETRRLQASVRLIRAVGGGWRENAPS